MYPKSVWWWSAKTTSWYCDTHTHKERERACWEKKRGRQAGGGRERRGREAGKGERDRARALKARKRVRKVTRSVRTRNLSGSVRFTMRSYWSADTSWYSSTSRYCKRICSLFRTVKSPVRVCLRARVFACLTLISSKLRLLSRMPPIAWRKV
jgi:hypothetical protein